MAKQFYMKITSGGTVYAKRSVPEWKQIFREEWSKIKLIVQSELQGRVFERVLGILFLTIEPIMMAFVYYFLTQVLLRGNLPSSQFLLIYIAVAFWRWFIKTVDGSPGVFATYATVLKQTSFSVFSLLTIYIGVEFFAFLVAFGVLVIFTTMLGSPPHFGYIFLIVPMIAQLSIMLFLTTLFSIAGAFVRDLQGTLHAFTAIWFYLSPGIYPISRVPKEYLWIYYLNPFAHILPAYQGIMLEGKVPDMMPLILITVVSLILAAGALWLLGRSRRYFFSFI